MSSLRPTERDFRLQGDDAFWFASTPVTTVAVGLASESDAAQSITGRKVRTVGQAVEEDVAQPISAGAIVVLLGQPSETDAAQPIAAVRRVTLGQASETDTAQVVRRVVLLGQATETETAQAIGRLSVRALGQAAEADAAQRIGRILRGPPVSGGSGVGFGTETLPNIGLLAGRRARPGFFRLKLTSLHYPENTLPGGEPARPARTLAHIFQFTDAEVEIPANDRRSGRAAISMHDTQVVPEVEPYSKLLHVVYVTPTTAHLVFWGVIVKPEHRSEPETITLHAVDRSFGLEKAQIRLGDQILNSITALTLPNVYGKGFVPLDAAGLRLLRDCGINTAAQTLRGQPDLGILDGDDTSTPLPVDTNRKMKVLRGYQAWSTGLELVEHEGAPDFELEPVDSVEGYYARLNTFDRQGSADPTALLLHDGFGLDNCRIDYEPGGELTTHAHTLSTGDKARITVADADSSAIYGAYTGWESTDYDASNTPALVQKGKQTIDTFGRPRDYFTVTLNDDADLYYLDDFTVGSACTAVFKRGEVFKSMEGHITKVTLRQIDSAGNVVPVIEAAVTSGTGDAGTDGEI